MKALATIHARNCRTPADGDVMHAGAPARRRRASTTNVEVVLKVLNGCGVNGHHWVFAGGLPDVEVRITVTDTDSRAARQYLSPLGTPFQPLQDTRAFAACD